MKPTETPCLQAIPSENKTSLPMSMEREAGSRHSAAHPKPHWSQSLLDLLGPSHFSPAQAIVSVKTQLPLSSCCSDSPWLTLCSPDHHWSLLNSSSIQTTKVLSSLRPQLSGSSQDPGSASPTVTLRGELSISIGMADMHRCPPFQILALDVWLKTTHNLRLETDKKVDVYNLKTWPNHHNDLRNNNSYYEMY